MRLLIAGLVVRVHPGEPVCYFQRDRVVPVNVAGIKFPRIIGLVIPIGRALEVAYTYSDNDTTDLYYKCTRSAAAARVIFYF